MYYTVYGIRTIIYTCIYLSMRKKRSFRHHGGFNATIVFLERERERERERLTFS